MTEDSPAPQSPRLRAPGYLLVVDGSAEAGQALRYAARRARDIGGAITLLHVIAPPEFLQWGSVQDMIAAEAQDAAEAALSRAAEEVVAISGIRPSLVVRQGKAADEVAAVLLENPHISALVLGAASKGQPGALVSHFSGERAGGLPVVVIIVPGSLGDAAIDSLTSSAQS